MPMSSGLRGSGVVVAVLWTLACRHTPATSNEGSIRPEPDHSGKADVNATQERIAHAFYQTIVPHLKACWPDVKEAGEIELKLTYRSEGGNWTVRQVELGRPALPADVSAAALQCMRDAARGSAFPLEPPEIATQAKEFVITWGWPVPLPPDTSTLARMVIADPRPRGPGRVKVPCLPACWECSDHQCTPTCVGGEACTGSGALSCLVILPECATGWSGSWTVTAARTE